MPKNNRFGQRQSQTEVFLRVSFGVVLLAVAAALFLGYRAGASGSGTVTMELDADTGPSGTPGTQSCIGSVTTGADVPVDLLISGVSDINGFGMRLLYDNNVVSLTGKDRGDSILGDAGLDVSDPLPDSSNSWLDGYAGTSSTAGGLLTRYTVHAVANGLTRLHLVVGNVDTNYTDSNFLTHLPDQTNDAFISVGSACPTGSTDRDGDTVTDLTDNCPNVANLTQPDRDSDTLGNACDPVVLTLDVDLNSRRIQNCLGSVTTGTNIDLVIRSADVAALQAKISYDPSIITFGPVSYTPSVLGTGGTQGSGPPDSTGLLQHLYTASSQVLVKNDGILARYSINAGSSGMTRLALRGGATESGWLNGADQFGTPDQTPLAFLVVGGACPSTANDRDSDGVTDYNDNCPNISNSSQADLEGDLIGDSCDTDDENDTIADAADNCPRTSNKTQLDTDSDGVPGVQPSAYPNDAFGGNSCDADDDSDGIDDAIDGPGQSLTFSNVFNDGAGSTGTISTRNGLFVRVRDETSPGGVRLNVSGVGGPASVNVCGTADLSLASGNETVVTCGSATVQVISGPLTMSIGVGFLRGSLPAGTTSTVTRTGASTQICNSSGSSADIVFTGIAISPGSCNVDSDTDGFFDAVETHIGTSVTSACGAAAWPPNINDSTDGKADIFDVGPLKLAFGSSNGNAAYNLRTDLNADNVVNIADLGLFRRFINLSC